MPAPNAEPKPGAPKVQQRLSYQDVIRRMQNGGSPNSRDAGPTSALGLDMAAISNRLASAVELRTIASVVKDMEPTSPPPSQQGQPAFAPIDLAALITALSATKAAGGDTNVVMLELLKYVQETDRDTLRQELAEMRHTLSAPGGNQTLETIQVLKELGMVGASDSKQGSTLETLGVLKELGILGNGHSQQPTFMEQLQGFMSVINLVRPPAPPQASPTLVQLPNGGTFVLADLLQLEEVKDRRLERQERLDLDRERMKSTRDMLSNIAQTVAEAAAAVRAERPAPAAVSPAAPREETTRYLVPCDFCKAVASLDLTTAPTKFTCTACHNENTILYADEAPKAN